MEFDPTFWNCRRAKDEDSMTCETDVGQDGRLRHHYVHWHPVNPSNSTNYMKFLSVDYIIEKNKRITWNSDIIQRQLMMGRWWIHWFFIVKKNSSSLGSRSTTKWRWHCSCCLIAVDISISRKKKDLLFRCSHIYEPQHNRNRLRPRNWTQAKENPIQKFKKK